MENVHIIIETLQSSLIHVPMSTADSVTISVSTSTANSEAIPTSINTADSKETNGIIFGLAFGLGIPVVVLGLAVILVFLKYQYYHHRKQATRNNWYAHIITKLHLNEFLCIRISMADNRQVSSISLNNYLSPVYSNFYCIDTLAVLNFLSNSIGERSGTCSKLVHMHMSQDSRYNIILSACLVPGSKLKLKEQVGEGDSIDL